MDGAFSDETYGISIKTVLMVKPFISGFTLPENIYEVGGQYSNPGQLGVFHYDLFDKVSHEGSDYYYMSYSENSMLYRHFSEVDPEISNGNFSLPFPRKRRWKNFSLTALWMELTLIILFPTMTYGGIRTICIRSS